MFKNMKFSHRVMLMPLVAIIGFVLILVIVNVVGSKNETLMTPLLRQRHPHSRLVAAYAQLQQLVEAWPETRTGAVYYHRFELPGGDPHDRVLAYTRYDGEGAIMAMHNLDCADAAGFETRFEFLSRAVTSVTTSLDTYTSFQLPHDSSTAAAQTDGSWHFTVLPLQTVVLRLQ